MKWHPAGRSSDPRPLFHSSLKRVTLLDLATDRKKKNSDFEGPLSRRLFADRKRRNRDALRLAKWRQAKLAPLIQTYSSFPRKWHSLVKSTTLGEFLIETFYRASPESANMPPDSLTSHLAPLEQACDPNGGRYLWIQTTAVSHMCAPVIHEFEKCKPFQTRCVFERCERNALKNVSTNLERLCSSVFMS